MKPVKEHTWQSSQSRSTPTSLNTSKAEAHMTHNNAQNRSTSECLELGHIQRKSISGARAEHIQPRSKPGGEASSAQGCTIEQEHTRAGARMEQKHFLSTINTIMSRAGATWTQQDTLNRNNSRALESWTKYVGPWIRVHSTQMYTA